VRPVALDDLTLSLSRGYETLRRAARVLADADLNIEAVCVPEGGPHRDAHLLVADGARAAALLEAAGIPAASLRRVHALRLPNRPGTLARVLDLVAPHEGLVEFVYQATDRGLILGSRQPERLLEVLAPVLAP